MSPRNSHPSFNPEAGNLFPDLPGGVAEPEITFAPGTRILWTHTKARLIEEYIRLFLLVTRHGVYIDCFAGPQNPEHEDKWSAKLVASITPDYLNHLYLCDADLEKFERLRAMVVSLPEKNTGRKRRTKFHIHHGDCNEWIGSVLAAGTIKDKTAVFCLLDQHNTECEWRTVEALARHKTSGYKIELFYFLATGWLQRIFAKRTDVAVLDRWWGGTGWRQLKGVRSDDVAAALRRRMVVELGYRHVYDWPILMEGDSGREMYRMIHATDHPKASQLMHTAYRRASGQDDRTDHQIALDLGIEIGDPVD